MFEINQRFLEPKATDPATVLIWKIYSCGEYISMDTFKGILSKLEINISINTVRTAFFNLNSEHHWFTSRQKKQSDKRGPKGLEYKLKPNVKHPTKKILMSDYMKKEFEKEMIINDKERKELLLDLLHCEPIEILGIKTTLKDAFYVYEFYKNNSDDLEYQYRNNDTTHLYHLNGAKYGTAEIIRLSQYVKSNRLYTQFKSY